MSNTARNMSGFCQSAFNLFEKRLFMNHIIEILFVFAFCSTAGWLLEVMYRSAVHRHFVNPGFLTGCALPIYGCGGLALYLLCLPLSSVENFGLRCLCLFIGGALVMTAIELIGGLFLRKVYHIDLWDYSELRFQYQGIISAFFHLLGHLLFFVLFVAVSTHTRKCLTRV